MLPMTFSHGDFLDIGVSFGAREKPLRTLSCLIEGCFLVGFARDFGYVMLLRCAIVLNSRDGFEETCPSIYRVTRKRSSWTKSLSENSKNSFDALKFRARV
jgi:hypothetical protein